MTIAIKRFLVLILSLGLYTSVFAQQEWRTWNSLNLNLPLTKKLDARIGHLRSYGLNTGFNNNFNQSKIEFGYDLPKKWDAAAGTLFMTFPNSGKTTVRGYVELERKMRLTKKINWFNTLHLETNSSNENRFRNRVVLSTRLGLRNRLDFLNIAPSLGYSLYYNAGGSTVDYYNETNQLVATQAPNGFHRGRFILSLNSKISKAFRVTLYYLNQHEFNLGNNKFREMNVINPTTGRIQHQFSNYNVLGISLSFTLGDGGRSPFFNSLD